MQKETQYPGFIISEDAMMADPDKVKVMWQILPPTCVREARSLLVYAAITGGLFQISQQLWNLLLD